MAQGEYWQVQQTPAGLRWARRPAADAPPTQEGECAGWESLPAPPGARLALCVPGHQARIHAVEGPARNRRRFLAALPFALEDRLLRPPEAYHLAPLAALSRRPGSGSVLTPVAVVERERLAGWMEVAERHGRRLALVAPDYLLLPEPAADAWLLDATEMPLLLRFPGPAVGAALHGAIAARPPGALLLALEQARAAPQRLIARTRGREQREQVANWRDWLRDFDVELEQIEADLPRPAWLARQPLPAACNLLTGPYRPRHRGVFRARRLAPAAGLAAALLLVLAAQWLLDGARMRAEHERLTGALESTYRQAFPEARNLVDPRHQMAQWLLAREQGAGWPAQADLLAWLEQLAPLIDAADGRLQGFDFDGENIALALSLPDFETLEALQAQLSQFAAARVERAELKDGRVQSRIQLEWSA